MSLPVFRLQQLREGRPMIHCLCNIVSARDCANLLLAAGASPIMAQSPEEVAEIAAAAGALVLNTGTPDAQKFSAAVLAASGAKAAGKPIVLDPVGVGASSWRFQNIRQLLAAASPAILRVNLGEAQTLLQDESRQKGIDSVLGADISSRAATARELAKKQHCTVLLSGAEDLVTDGSRTLCLRGGSSRTRQITGAGCMLSALCGAFAAVEPDAFSAAALASAYWKACAALAEQQSTGLGSFSAALFDAADALSPTQLEIGCEQSEL